MSVCLKCGLPEELCTCSELVKEEQLITIKEVKRRYGKPVTIVKGIDFDELGSKERKQLLKSLKRKLACGGTYDKENQWIELQGNHKRKVKKLLTKKGYKVKGVKQSITNSQDKVKPIKEETDKHKNED